MPARRFFSDTIELHRKMQDLTSSLEVENEPEELNRLSGELVARLIPHIQAEEEVLYPALDKNVKDGDDRNVLLEAHQAHTVILDLVEKLQNAAADTDEFQGIVLFLNRLLTMHIEQEEELMYEMAREHLRYDDFENLAARMQEAQKVHLEETREDARRTKRSSGVFGRRRKEKDLSPAN